jgi:hypothetical protein
MCLCDLLQLELIFRTEFLCLLFDIFVTRGSCEWVALTQVEMHVIDLVLLPYGPLIIISDDETKYTHC